jgi:hypothetical protein
MAHAKTNLGGAVQVLGASLAGIGFLTQLSQISPNTSTILSPTQLAVMWYVALFGVIVGAIGKALTAYYAADASIVNNIADAVDAINQTGPNKSAVPAVSP